MRAKWYLGIFTAILVLSGLREQQTPPNQEIVLQFTDETITLDEVENTIAIVERQLQDIGVTNIQVGEADNGILKITYYSDIDIEGVKSKLFKQSDLLLSYTNSNQNNNTETPKHSSNDYDFDVFEIQNSYDVKSDIEGYLLDSKLETDLFISLNNSNARYNEFAIIIKNEIDVLAYNSYKNLTLALDHIFNKIPEVRAGPIS